MKWWQRQSLRFKLALGIGLAMLLVLGGALLAVSQYIRAQLWQREAQAGENLNAVAATLLKDAMMVGHRDQIQDALDKLGQNIGGRIDAIAVFDDQAVLTSFASGFPGGRTIHPDSLAQDIEDPGCWGCHQLPAGERPAMTVVSLEGQEVMRNVVPLYNEPRCQTCHGTGQQVLGDSIVDLRLDQFQRSSTTVTLGLAGGMGLAVLVVALVLYLLLRGTVLSPLSQLVMVTQAVTQGDLEQQVSVRSDDEVGQVGTAFNRMTAQLRELIGSLEQRVADRTRDLEQRSAYLEASANVGQAATSILDANLLIQQAVDLIKERFDLYYVGLFLLDARNEWAVLGAGTGEAGRKMVASGHRLRVGEGMIGWSIANAQARIALDIGSDATRFDNPDLPETRSEVAIPLRSRGRVLGALSVQSIEEAAFNQDSIVVLQIMADQVAVALDNARLFQQSQESLEAERRAYGELSLEGWIELRRARPNLGYRYSEGIVEPVRDANSEAVASILRLPALKIPVRYRDHTLGNVVAHKRADAGEWTSEETTLIEMLTEQLSTALESARLYQDTQSRAARDRLLGEVTARMRETLDIDTMVQTAIREIGQAIGVAEVEVRLGRSQATTGTSASEETVPLGNDGHGGRR